MVGIGGDVELVAPGFVGEVGKPFAVGRPQAVTHIGILGEERFGLAIGLERQQLDAEIARILNFGGEGLAVGCDGIRGMQKSIGEYRFGLGIAVGGFSENRHGRAIVEEKNELAVGRPDRSGKSAGSESEAGRARTFEIVQPDRSVGGDRRTFSGGNDGSGVTIVRGQREFGDPGGIADLGQFQAVLQTVPGDLLHGRAGIGRVQQHSGTRHGELGGAAIGVEGDLLRDHDRLAAEFQGGGVEGLRH